MKKKCRIPNGCDQNKLFDMTRSGKSDSQLIEIDSKVTEMIDLIDKDFRIAIVIRFNYVEVNKHIKKTNQKI